MIMVTVGRGKFGLEVVDARYVGPVNRRRRAVGERMRDWLLQVRFDRRMKSLLRTIGGRG